MSEYLKIPKREKVVTLWVHPEGRVIGSLFLNLVSRSGGAEDPSEILNEPTPFVVLKRHGPEEIRFYNKAAIVRVEYAEDGDEALPDIPAVPCCLSLTDGSRIEGLLRQPMPPGYTRLYDYLNCNDGPFLKVYVGEGQVCLVNRAYIVCATSREARWPQAAVQSQAYESSRVGP
ncbi:MAG: hypothetical protein KatS3mg131_4008 [Candidatus Tectimicrobiota bacterium]|nr:MAG: hypothetical protein KatS3mg131_4008 [Candidatus Tectomicrobia bacterium]